jgi:RNA polymerase sigma factor (sigma-70 family)
VASRTEDLGAGRFNTTHWSVVLACGGESDTLQAKAALASLFQTYWYPLYAYVRRRGYSEQDAEDLVQGFCAHLLEKHALTKADPQRGKFRTFLLSSLQNFLVNEKARAHAQKRNCGGEVFSLDGEDARGRYRLEPADELTPDVIFEMRWAHAVLEEALAKLRADFVLKGKERLFDELVSFLSVKGSAESYQQVAARLALPLSAIKTSVHRLRQDYRMKLREEIGKTVSTQDEIDEELRYLRRVLAGANS